jgi:hypothetical protein
MQEYSLRKMFLDLSSNSCNYEEYVSLKMKAVYSSLTSANGVTSHRIQFLQENILFSFEETSTRMLTHVSIYDKGLLETHINPIN